MKDALEKGANPDRTDWMGQTALHEACACGMREFFYTYDLYFHYYLLLFTNHFHHPYSIIF